MLYGSNPVPPKHRAAFKAILSVNGEYLDENGFLKPGTYIFKVLTEKDIAAFCAVEVVGK